MRASGCAKRKVSKPRHKRRGCGKKAGLAREAAPKAAQREKELQGELEPALAGGSGKHGSGHSRAGIKKEAFEPGTGQQKGLSL